MILYLNFGSVYTSTYNLDSSSFMTDFWVYCSPECGRIKIAPSVHTYSLKITLTDPLFMHTFVSGLQTLLCMEGSEDYLRPSCDSSYQYSHERRYMYILYCGDARWILPLYVAANFQSFNITCKLCLRKNKLFWLWQFICQVAVRILTDFFSLAGFKQKKKVRKWGGWRFGWRWWLLWLPWRCRYKWWFRRNKK